jgi:tetratricopeptide (TPR) repeat protein
MDAITAESLLNFSEQTSAGLKGLGSKALFEQLEEKYDDLLAALQWFVGQEQTDEALRLATSLAPFWTATKRLEEGSIWSDRVLGLPGGEDAHRGRVTINAGFHAFWKGEDERASALYSRALELGRQIGDPTLMANGLCGLARIALRSDVEEARRLCREALAVTEGSSDRVGRSNAFHVLGVAAQMAGDLLEARDWMNQRLAIARELEHFGGISMEAGNLSMVERQLGNLDRADALAREALGIYHERGDEWAMPYGISGLAAIAAERGELERAAMLVGAAEAMMESQGAAWPPDERVHYERMLTLLPGEMGAGDFDRARAIGHAMSPDEAVDFALGPRQRRHT